MLRHFPNNKKSPFPHTWYNGNRLQKLSFVLLLTNPTGAQGGTTNRTRRVFKKKSPRSSANKIARHQIN
jgi:hypothetical protein